MKKIFCTQWQGIQFSSFNTPTPHILAGASFYNDFYTVWFSKYSGYDQLPSDWRINKDQIADWLASLMPSHSRVLSVGCGIGYIEQRLWAKHSDHVDLHVSDYASVSMDWLRQVVPHERIHDAEHGFDCLGKFDIIYLSAVDYALPNDLLIPYISCLSNLLNENGQIIIISACFIDDSLIDGIIHDTKAFAKRVLALIGIRPLGQFWGWLRSRSEYCKIMRSAKIFNLSDGFLVTPTQKTFWIKGCPK